jgi:hypothetical protein
MTSRNVEDIERLKSYLQSSTDGSDQGLGARVQRAVVAQTARHLVELLDGLARDELRGLALRDALGILELVRDASTIRETVCVLRCDQLRSSGDTFADESIAMVLGWLPDGTSQQRGSLFLVLASEADLMKDSEYLALALRARRAGWRVAVGTSAEDRPILLVQLGTKDGAVSLSASQPSNSAANTSVIRFGPAADGAPPASGTWQEVHIPAVIPTDLIRDDDTRTTNTSLTVSDLFGDLILLRDLEPRAPTLDGIGALRAELGWDPIYIPRKSEPDYARALTRIIAGVTPGGPEQIIYVGDTLLNDGGAIRGLQHFGPPGGVWGFLCGATRGSDTDFVVGRVYYGARWSSLAPFLRSAAAEGLALGERTYALFDLDQTVYAAKGRDDEPLLGARWDAVREYLESIVPSYKFDPSRAETLYREFDDDVYHPVTRDNLDYVVLLVLAVAAGLADASEIGNYSNSSRPSIGALAEELRRRASARIGHEDIGAVLDAIKAIYYNTLAGDQTPCKDFRQFECLAMARRMRGDEVIRTGADQRIVLNREVTDLIGFLRSTGTKLIAVSDRPVEAAVVEDDGPGGETTDLMKVPMAVRGVSLREFFQRWRTLPSAH